MRGGSWTVYLRKIEVRKIHSSTQGNSGESMTWLFSELIYVWLLFSGIPTLHYQLVKTCLSYWLKRV